jgi:choline dehydrogenase-like flavoprotein
MADDVLGKRSLTSFEYCIVGSGAGGGTAAHVLTAAGHSVLVLEAGPNPFPGLDRHGPLAPTLHSNDELKYAVRGWIDQDSFLEPRVFRKDTTIEGSLEDDVNTLPKAVGGAFQHADCKTPRFAVADFKLKSKVESLLANPANADLAVPGFGASAASANFADWPFRYDDLEPFYVEAEQLYGVQGQDGDNPYESRRSGPYPMPPGAPMYLALLLAGGASRTALADAGSFRPHTFPAAITSRFYGDGPLSRPPCVDCGLCSGFGCPNHSKGSPAVVTLRRALLSGKCQLRYNAHATRLLNDGGSVTGVEYVDADGKVQVARADRYILAASAIESARLCLNSERPAGGVLGNVSGQRQLGQNLMFHFQTVVSGFVPQRLHGQRGRAVTHGISDCRGFLPGGEDVRIFTDGNGKRAIALGGICEFGGSQGLPITEDGNTYALSLLSGLAGTRFGAKLKDALRDQVLGQHLLAITMQAEDAPQTTNFVDLDARYKDVYGQRVPRITYQNHDFEKSARGFYVPYLKQLLTNAGATDVFAAPCATELIGVPDSHHLMGTLRMGEGPGAVVDPTGKFHDVTNLYACDGSVFVTSAGWNPTLTIFALALKIAHGLAGTPPAIS